MAAKVTAFELKPTDNNNNGCNTNQIECECCALIEECTPAYIAKIRDRFHGRWICGLCSEAVKDEIFRSKPRPISTEEALNRHMKFSKSFRSLPPPAPMSSTEDLISAMRQLLRRSLESPRAARSVPASPTREGGGEERGPLARSESCFSTIAG